MHFSLVLFAIAITAVMADPVPGAAAVKPVERGLVSSHFLSRCTIQG